MSSSREYLQFITDQLSELEGITHRAMMGEYILYCKDKVVGRIYDDRFLIKPTKSAKELMPQASLELPYEGAKEMLLIDDVENRCFLAKVITAVYHDLPAKKKKQSQTLQ